MPVLYDGNFKLIFSCLRTSTVTAQDLYFNCCWACGKCFWHPNFKIENEQSYKNFLNGFEITHRLHKACLVNTNHGSYKTSTLCNLLWRNLKITSLTKVCYSDCKPIFSCRITSIATELDFLNACCMLAWLWKSPAILCSNGSNPHLVLYSHGLCLKTTRFILKKHFGRKSWGWWLASSDCLPPAQNLYYFRDIFTLLFKELSH